MITVPAKALPPTLVPVTERLRSEPGDYLDIDRDEGMAYFRRETGEPFLWMTVDDLELLAAELTLAGLPRKVGK